MMTYRGVTFWGLMASAMFAVSAMAQDANPLERPDPEIGEGFATVMAEQFEAEFEIDRLQADCLVYEVVMMQRETGDYSRTPVEAARAVSNNCALDL